MKRALYIAGVIVVSILLVLTMLFTVLMSDRVENSVVQLVTAEFSRALGTEARVGAIEYQFPARVKLRDVYLEDKQQDTLFHAHEVYAHFSPFALRQGEIRFNHVRLTGVRVNTYLLPDSTWNYAFLAAAFASEKEKDPLRSIISVRDVKLEDIRFRHDSYEVDMPFADMDLHHLSYDALDAQIHDLKMIVSRSPAEVYPTPLVVSSLRAHMIASDTAGLSFPVLRAQLPHSHLDLSGVEIRADSMVSMEMDTRLVPADIALIVPRLRGFTRKIEMTGYLSGTLDSLLFDQLSMYYDGRKVLDGDVAAMGLLQDPDPYLRANLTELHTNAAQMQDFLSQFYGRPIKLPKELHRLGEVRYRGLAAGRLRDLTLHGAFRTALGAITTDGTFHSDSLFEHMRFDARIVGRRFRLGRMLNDPKIGTVTLDFYSKGQIDYGVVRGDVKAHLREFTYNNYTYADLHVNGRYDPQRYEGDLEIHDPHLDVTFEGVVDLQDENPEINFNLRCFHFDNSPLIARNLPSLQTSFALAVEMDGATADEISGYMVLDSLFVATEKDSLLMTQMQLQVDAANARDKHITMRSDFGVAEGTGSFSYADIVPACQAMMHYYLPSAVAAPKKRWQPVELHAKTHGKDLSTIQRLFTVPVKLSDEPILHVDLRLRPWEKPSVNIAFHAERLDAGNTPVSDLQIFIQSLDQGSAQLALTIEANALDMHTVFRTQAYHDSLFTHLQLHNTLTDSVAEERISRRRSMSFRDEQKAMIAAQRAGEYGGDIFLITHFDKYAGRPLVEFEFLKGYLIVRDSLYQMADSRLVWRAVDTTLQVSHFSFEGGGQRLNANGIASRRTTDTLELDLKQINAAYVVPFILPKKTIMFNGMISGQANVTSAFRRPHMDTQIHVDSMGLNNCYFGDAEVDLHISDSLAFHADVYRTDTSGLNSRNIVELDGKALFDGSGIWCLDMVTDSVPLNFVNHWTSNILHDLDGTATGTVTVGGWKGMTYVLLRAEARDAHLTLPWTGVRYTIPRDTIVMDTTAIRFPNVHLTDEEGNSVLLDGEVRHNQFRDFELDLHVDANDALVFGADEAGQMMRGQVYATGHVDVTGTEKDIRVVANARTSRNSHFRLSIDNAASAYESSFIHFSSPEDTIEVELDSLPGSGGFVPSRCLLQLNLEVNPQLLFQLVLGERNGDMIQARGNGQLQLTYDTSNEKVTLYGTYDISQGTMGYTVANMIRKEFTVGEGSTIIFAGNPSAPQLDVTAKYRVTANIRDLFGDEADQISTSRSNVPVNTCIHMTGSLSNPILQFSLEFPNSDQTLQQQALQVINTDEMMMRQVIYLLVFGRFFTPDYMSNASAATLNSTYSLLSSTVTSQINAWLSKLTTMLTLGVAIRTDGEGADASQEYEAQFQLQPVDRLVINGNVGYRYNDVSNQPFFGDLDVEVLLTEDGQWRLKGYTHTVDKYSLRQASTIQGAGIMWKKDFNWSDLKKKKKKAKK